MQLYRLATYGDLSRLLEGTQVVEEIDGNGTGAGRDELVEGLLQIQIHEGEEKIRPREGQRSLALRQEGEEHFPSIEHGWPPYLCCTVPRGGGQEYWG